MKPVEIDTNESKQKAKELRKAGEYEKAKELYASLWLASRDKFDGVGLLHCLRKLKKFDDAIPLADELANTCSDFNWCRMEVIWTYIEGVLSKLREDEPVEKVLDVAQKIMRMNPEGLAAKVVVFRVLKATKAEKRWDLLNEWVTKLDPTTLSGEPMTDANGRQGWCDQSLWYNYRLNGLLEVGKHEDVIDLVDSVLGRYPKENKFFQRLKALAHYKLGRLDAASGLYQELTESRKADWWLLHEHALVLRDLGQKDQALLMMYKAAGANLKLELMISLFSDIAHLCRDLGKGDDARNHLLLCKFVRERQGWPVSRSLLNEIDQLAGPLASEFPKSLDETLARCKKAWKDSLGLDNESERHSRKCLMGRVNLGGLDRPFCFVEAAGNESFFCFKADLPPGIKTQEQVIFDAVPSFDKKKNKPSWKAVNIKRANAPETTK